MFNKLLFFHYFSMEVKVEITEKFLLLMWELLSDVQFIVTLVEIVTCGINYSQHMWEIFLHKNKPIK